jgi:ABC-type amino acid transport substrate-binding protein
MFIIGVGISGASAQAQPVKDVGPPLKVAVYSVAPYANVDAAGRISGHSVRLWTMVAAELEKPFELTAVESVDGIIAGLKSGAFDIAIGALTVTPAREEQVDFSYPTHPSGVVAAIRKPSGFIGASEALVATLVELVPLFLLVAGLILAAGLATWLIERNAPTSTHNPHTTISSLGDGVYWAAVTMTTVGYGDKTPKSGSARVLTIIWMFTGVIVISIFSGTVTAKITATQFNTLAGSETALRLNRIAAVRNSSGAEYLASTDKVFAIYDTLETALAALAKGEVDAVFNSRGALIHGVAGDFASRLEVLGSELTRGYMAFALPPGSGLKENLNRALLRVVNSRAWAAEREAMAREYSQSGQPDRTTF